MSDQRCEGCGFFAHPGTCDEITMAEIQAADDLRRISAEKDAEEQPLRQRDARTLGG